MITVKKELDHDFKILNLADIQLCDEEWEEDQGNITIMLHTVRELVKRVKPNLITVNGDIAWAWSKIAHEALADFLDSFEIPWAPIWGNHENEGGTEFINQVVEGYEKHKYCLYEKGDAELGNGNYVICIEENGKIIEGVIMVDTHNKELYTDEDGNNSDEFARLTQKQIEWYGRQIKVLSEKGCKDTLLITHIPIYAYSQAAKVALGEKIATEGAPLEVFLSGECWKEGYEDSVGAQLGGIGTCKTDDGVFDVVRKLQSTKHIIAGHDHINNWMITYKGVRLIYGLKTGPGCYYNPQLNGGTVVRVTSNGIEDVYHEYVDVSDIS